MYIIFLAKVIFASIQLVVIKNVLLNCFSQFTCLYALVQYTELRSSKKEEQVERVAASRFLKMAIRQDSQEEEKDKK